MEVWKYGGPTDIVREEVVFDDGRSVRGGPEEGRLGGGGGAGGLGGWGSRGNTGSFDLFRALGRCLVTSLSDHWVTGWGTSHTILSTQSHS